MPVDVSSTLIILFTIYGAFLQHSGAGKFFIDFSMALMGNKAEQRRPHRGAVVVPARRTVGLRRRHHGDDRRGRLSDDEARRLREERGRRTARRRRARRDHLAAGARRRRLPDRRVPQDQLSRRDLDGDHPDLLYYLSLLFMVELDAKRFGARMRRHVAGPDALADDQALRLPLHVADLDHRLHAVGLFADALGVLVDRADLRAELPHPRDRAHAEAAGARAVRRLDPACSPRPPPAPPPASSSASSR